MSFEEAEERLDRFDVAIVGPGLDDSDRDAVIPILSKASRVLLDAGGLDPALLDAAAEGGTEVVVTPTPPSSSGW